MATRAQSDFEHTRMNRYLRDEVISRIAQDMGLNELPMDDENFDFFGSAAALAQRIASKYGLVAGSHMVSQVIHDLVYHIPKLSEGQTEYTEEQKNRESRRGPIYNYEAAVKSQGVTPESYPFNRFFMYLFKQKVTHAIQKRHGTGKNRTRPHLSLGSGQFDKNDPSGAVSEGGVPDVKALTPNLVLDRRDQRELVDEVIPGLLAKERNAKALLVLYDMYFRKKGTPQETTLEEVGKYLNQLGKEDSGYWPEKGGMKWSTSTLGRYKMLIKEITRKYLQEEKLKEHARALTPKEQQEIFQSRRA